MSKLSLAICSVVFGAWTAFADSESFLYWMIDAESAAGFQDYSAATTIKVAAYSNSENATSPKTYLTPLYWGDGSTLASVGNAADVRVCSAYGVGFYASLAQVNGSYQNYSYVIELWSGANADIWLGKSEVLDGNNAAAYVSLADSSGIRAAMQSPWAAGNFTAAPEPNSAVLTLIGLAVLGLRRRKAVKA